MPAIHRALGHSLPVHTNSYVYIEQQHLQPPQHQQQQQQQQQYQSEVNSSNNVNCLPKQFVTSMRTLFEIMDEKRTGYIKLIDIENRWQDDNQSKDVPRGLVECLRNVTPPSGLLSFERFCIGLKICLVNNQLNNSGSSTILSNESAANQQRSPSAPLLDLESNLPKPQQWNNTATVRPNNAALQTAQRTLSLPQLSPDSDSDLLIEPVPVIPGLFGPPKPPRTSLDKTATSPASNNGFDKTEIRNALQNWQMGVLKNNLDARLNRGMGDGETAELVTSTATTAQMQQKKSTGRKREPRRHTLQNGIDYNMLKRLKQFEQEKDVLIQGLNAVERTREWYMKQIVIVQDKMKYLGRMGSHIEPWSESYKERIDLQRARVIEVNRQLEALTDSWERGGFPMHMNLALRRHPGINETYPQDIVNQLKRQNRQLTEEVSVKSERIAALEREKASILRENGFSPVMQII